MIEEFEKRLHRCEGAKAARLRLGRRGAKVLYEKNIGEERSHSTEVRKERSETKKERIKGSFHKDLSLSLKGVQRSS